LATLVVVIGEYVLLRKRTPQDELLSILVMVVSAVGSYRAASHAAPAHRLALTQSRDVDRLVQWPASVMPRAR